jgi:predicted permease
VDLWIPIAMQSEVMQERPGLLTNPNPPWVRIVARLRDGVSAATAQSAVQVVYRRSVEDRINLTPEMLAGQRQAIVVALPENRGISNQRAQLGRPLFVLMTVVGLVLLMACANVANLLLARSAVRQREMGVRLAVGAGRGQVVRQLLTESVVLALVSGVAGLALASWGTAALGAVVASGLVPFDLELHPDVRVIAFTFALSVITGLLFGLAPAWRASSVQLATGLRSGSDRMAHRFRLHRSLLVLQVAVSVVLLVAGGLFARTLRNLEGADLGFDRQQLTMVSVGPGQVGLKGPQIVPLMMTLAQRAATLPGVRAVTTASSALLAGGGTQSPVTVFGRERGAEDVEQWSLVGPGFFQVIGQGLAAGREFTDRDDEGSPRVAVINESFALKYFGTRDAVGKRFGMRRDTGNEIEVVGVVADVKTNSMRDAEYRMIYLPYLQDRTNVGRSEPILLLRTAAAGPAFAAKVRDLVHQVNPLLPVLDVVSMEQAVGRSLMQERLVAGISSLFGALAVVLACIGLYGVVTYTAARRTGEIGIRLTMGATSAGVLAMMVRESLELAMAGVAVGLPVALLLARFVSTLFFGVSPADFVTLLTAAGLMLVVAALASGVPAWRASRLDPIVALRSE